MRDKTNPAFFLQKQFSSQVGLFKNNGSSISFLHQLVTVQRGLRGGSLRVH